jgi:tetratricopeptide (TPR) repeat protein
LIGLDICHALAAVHAIGLLHRDIKAQNVMRAPGGRIVLIDFGLGEERRVETQQPKELAGTPLYIAPELFETGQATLQTEIYALGVLLFYLTTGGYPVEAGSFEELKQAHRDGSRRLLGDLRPGLPRRFVEMVERATAAAPAGRYRSVAQMEAALQAIVGGRPVDTRASLRLAAPAVFSVAAIFVAGGGAYWWITRAPSGPRPIVWITDTIAPPNQPDFAGLTIALREQIAQSDMLRIFDTANIPVLLDRMTLPPGTRLSGRLRRDLAQRARVSYIVDSTVLQVGAELRLKVAVESMGPLTIVAARQNEREFPFDDPSKVSVAVLKAADWVRETAREPAAGIAIANNNPAEITTDSLSALAHFAEGERLAAAGDPVRAIVEWKAAVGSDPDFLQAHMRLGDVLRTNGRAMESLVEYAAAYHLLDKRKLGLRESFRIRSAFLFDSGDMLAADKIHAEWAARFPDDPEPLIKRVRPLLYSGSAKGAVEALLRAQQLNPQSTSAAGLLAMCHISLGDWNSAAQDTSRLRALHWEDQAALFDAVTEFLRGRGAEALRHTLAVRDRNRTDPNRSDLRINAVLQAASMLSELGRGQRAERLLEDDLSPAQRMGAPADLAREEAALAAVRIESSERASAREAAIAALDLEAGPDILRAAGPLLAMAGGKDAALARLRSFEAKVPADEARLWPVTRIPRLLIEGEILLLEGRAAAAVRKLSAAAGIDAPGEPHDVLAEALETTGERQSALEEWLRIVNDDNYRLLWAAAPYTPPGGTGRHALERAVELCEKAGNSAGTEARCEQARQRLNSLRNMTVPN